MFLLGPLQRMRLLVAGQFARRGCRCRLGAQPSRATSPASARLSSKAKEPPPRLSTAGSNLWPATWRRKTCRSPTALFVTILFVALQGRSASGRPPPRGTRDGERVRALALRPEEATARATAFERFTHWTTIASPNTNVAEIARCDVPLLCMLLEEFCYQSYEMR